MAKIFAPHEQYTGISAGVSFVKGEGETKDKNVIRWFNDHGYRVEEAKKKGSK